MTLELNGQPSNNIPAELSGTQQFRSDGPASAATSQDVLLSVQDLHVWFELKRWGFLNAGHVRAVDGVSFDLHHGEAIGIVGESGCGKTTLMKTILGLYQPVQGNVKFDSQDLSELTTRDMQTYRSKVGYVQQDPYGALPPFMTVERILSEPMIVSGIKNRSVQSQRIHDVLTEVKMTPVDDFLTKFPHMLSGGQQQRIVIAARRVCAGRDPEAFAEATGFTQPFRDLHHPRSLDSALLLRQDLRDVRGKTHRAGGCERLVAHASASLYPGAAGGHPGPGLPERTYPQRIAAGRAAQPCQPPGGVPLPSTLPQEDRRAL